jgi:hypothetical protein
MKLLVEWILVIRCGRLETGGLDGTGMRVDGRPYEIKERDTPKKKNPRKRMINLCQVFRVVEMDVLSLI